MGNAAGTSVVRDLCRAVADLTGPPTRRERLEATGRLVVLASILVAGAWLYWGLPLGPAALAGLVVAGVAYALLLIATHELVHGTLLGWSRVEGSLGCLLSWPMAWPFLTYSRLHHLHHRWNGRDPRDPERTEVLPQEWDGGSRWHRLWQHHQLLLRCGLLGGLGLIADTVRKGWQLRALDRSLLRSQLLDGAGVVLLHGALLVLVL